MIDPLPGWARGVIALMALVVLAVVASQILDDGRDAQPADWRVEPTAQLGPATLRVPIIVNETACASGRSAEGRIIANVDYEPSVVRIDISVRPRGGDLECPGNPDTPFVVELDEALGDRTIVGERWPLPSGDQDLVDALGSHLGEDWETSVIGALDRAGSQVQTDALLVGTWWAVADYCTSFTSQSSTQCHDEAAAYLVTRLGIDPRFESSHFAGAGAVGAVLDDGYDGTASFLDLPPAAGDTSQGRPGF